MASRVPHPLWALAVLAAFAAFFPLVADDYGLGPDDVTQRKIAAANLRYIMGDVYALHNDHNRYYGVAFELPALLVGQALGLTDSRDIFLLRRAATHLLFLCAAFACYALAYRLFNSVPLALIAMLLFLLHPRLYAHSIFNSKDSPFLAMFMIALYLAHRAFAKNGVWAFALLGVLVALATNIRIVGIILVPAVLGLRLIDLFFADGWDGRNGRRRVLLSGGAFAGAAAWAFFVSTPYLWSDPLSLIDALGLFSSHIEVLHEPYLGSTVRSDELPWHYIPTWIWITTPPLTLLFAALGVAAIVKRGADSPGAVLRGGDIRFGLLLIALFMLPIAGIAALGVNIYNGWRHVHFLYAPLCLLAVFALHLLPQEFKPGTLRTAARWGISAVMCAGLAAALLTIVRLHPSQQDYFNFFVDRESPERLRKQYTMDYWAMSQLQGLRRLMELHPSGHIFATPDALDPAFILPTDQRRRIIIDVDADPYDNYHIPTWYHMDDLIYNKMDEIHSVKIYGSSIMRVYGERARHEARAAARAARLRELRAAAAATEPIARSRYDVYLNADENSIAYFKDPCADEDIADDFFLHVTPVNLDDLSENRKPRGFYNLNFAAMLPRIGADTDTDIKEGRVEFISTIEGRCAISVNLPDYPIARIATGQYNADGRVWSEGIDLAAFKRAASE